MLEFLGEGYGMAAHAVRCEREVDRTLARLGGDRDLQYESYWYGSYDEDDYGTSQGGSKWKTTTLRQVLECLVSYKDRRRGQMVQDLGDLQSVSDVSEWFQDYNSHQFGNVSSLFTLAKAKEYRLERRRIELEATASAFAAQCGHKVGTKEYILAARRSLDEVRYQRQRWNDPETRAEQWAACAFAGVGSSVYFDDLNFENSRYESRASRLGEVLDWLEQTCPLLMRQVEEEHDNEEEC